ncbi:MAG UNVERIFIED_CONTAM: hypothetical protein LVT10_01405 [Anaerolineae bacterium]
MCGVDRGMIRAVQMQVEGGQDMGFHRRSYTGSRRGASTLFRCQNHPSDCASVFG